MNKTTSFAISLIMLVALGQPTAACPFCTAGVTSQPNHVRSFRPKHVDAPTLAKTLRELLGKEGQSAIIHSEDEVIVNGHKPMVDTLMSLVERLDTKQPPSRITRVVRLKYADAAGASALAQRFVANAPDTTSPQLETVIVAEPISNSLIISCPSGVAERVFGFVEAVDMTARREKRVDAKQLEQLQAAYDAAESRLQVEQANWRRFLSGNVTGDQHAKAVAGLKAAIEKSFVARQALQLAEVESYRQQLQETEALIRKREAQKSSIIQQRLDELIQAEESSATEFDDDSTEPVVLWIAERLGASLMFSDTPPAKPVKLSFPNDMSNDAALALLNRTLEAHDFQLIKRVSPKGAVYLQLIKTIDIVPSWDRWQIEYPANPTRAAEIIDFFKVEFGVCSRKAPGSREGVIDYVSGLSAEQPTTRRGPTRDETRLYFTWRSEIASEVCLTAAKNAGVDIKGKLMMLFYPDDVVAELTRLESAQRKSLPLNRIEKTKFGVKPSKDGFSFYVTEQILSDKSKN